MSALPKVRFFRSPAGRVAYAQHGRGPLLICAAWWVSHVEADWDNPGFREFFERLGEHFTVVRYDRIGSGLSDRERDSVELDDEVETLAALVAHLEARELSLFGLACGGPPALRFAVRQPEVVDKLVLFGSYVQGAHVGTSEMHEALKGLVRAHWGLGSATISDLFAPGLDAEERRAFAKAQVAAASADMSAKLLALTFEADVSESAEACRTPTLVVHRKGDRTIPFAAGRELAASLPDATLCALEGRDHVPWYGDVAAAADVVIDFLGRSDSAPARATLADRTMERSGDVWAIAFDGKVAHLKDSRGIGDLAVLLAAPGREVHAHTLWSGLEPEAVAPTAQPMLDDAALAAYRRRLQTIDDALEHAESIGASERIEALRSERSALADELRGAIGRGGRKRALNDPNERARKAVTARIRAAMKKIASVHATLGEHLKEHVTTGNFCGYGDEVQGAWAIREPR